MVRFSKASQTAKRRLSANANLRQKGVSHRRPNSRQKATRECRHHIVADSADNAVGPTSCLASASAGPAAPLPLQASTAPRHYRVLPRLSSVPMPHARRTMASGSDGARSKLVALLGTLARNGLNPLP